jgi:hypothetical protein
VVVDALLGRFLGTDLGAGFEALLALDPEADQRGHLAANLDRLVLAEVAQVHHLDLAVGVLVDRERVDQAHRELSRSFSSSSMILPWKSGFSKPSTGS